MFIRLSNPNDFDNAPEHAMGVHYGNDAGGLLYLVLGGQVAIRLGEYPSPWEGAPPLSEWLAKGVADCSRAFEDWLKHLRNEVELTPDPPANPIVIVGVSVGTLPQIPTPPSYPVGVYGHVPFPGTTQSGDVFCRYEPWPISRRIRTSSSPMSVVPNTFAGPISEARFIACGFGAVARLACPNILPACFKWEFEVAAGTALRCGAAIPLFGQAGGGVEVELLGSSSIPCLWAAQARIPPI